jgi:hypothetical protein
VRKSKLQARDIETHNLRVDRRVPSLRDTNDGKEMDEIYDKQVNTLDVNIYGKKLNILDGNT